MLIVDDRRTNRLLVTKLLHPLGFDLREAANGHEALDIWAVWKPHLIWMDMRMPVMDGYETTQRIQQEEVRLKHDHTVIIALTASALEEERAVMLNAGCDDYLRKPFRDADLFELMSTHIGVKFVYEERSQVAERSQVSQEDQATREELYAAMTSLPSELLTSLEDAARFCDIANIAGMLPEIRRYSAPLADAVARLVEDFYYDGIVALIQGEAQQEEQTAQTINSCL